MSPTDLLYKFILSGLFRQNKVLILNSGNLLRSKFCHYFEKQESKTAISFFFFKVGILVLYRHILP